MKSRILVAAVLAVPSVASARAVGIGLGVELPPITLAENAAVDYEQRLVSLEVPVFAGRWRFAPAFAYASGVPDSQVQLDGAEVTRLSFGAGVSRAFAPTEDLRSWAGARAGLVRRELADTGGLLDPFVGAVAGGEYFFGSAWSLGSELRLTYSSLEKGQWNFSSQTVPLTGPTPFPSSPILAEPEPVRGWSLVADFVLSLRFYPW